MKTRELTYAQAISEALIQAMEDDPQVFIFGLGVDDYKGIFGTTREAFLKFGGERVFDVPASEGALTGIAIGAALNKKRPILVHARNDFMFLTLDQMINNAAKWKYVYAGQSSVPMVVRGVIGKGWGQGPTHSQSIQSLLAHIPGLMVVMPSNAYDAKGIILKSVHLDSPVVILEHRALYDTCSNVPLERYQVEFGRAKIVRVGKDLTVVATSLMVQEALKAYAILEKDGILIEIIDPVTIQPLDEETILRSVEKTGRLIAVDTGWLSCGFASHIAATVAEKAFESLKSPLRRITPPASPCPVSKTLEDAFYPGASDIVKAVYELLERKISRDFRTEEVVDTFIGPY